MMDCYCDDCIGCERVTDGDGDCLTLKYMED